MSNSPEKYIPTIGDVVRILPYNVVPKLYPDAPPSVGRGSGEDGVVMSLNKRWAWQTEWETATIRVVRGDEARQISRPLTELQLVTPGAGYVVLGVTHPWSADELRQQRWAAFVAKCEAFDQTVEGYPNVATQRAALYLNQEPRWHNQLRSHWRKDGSIHPEKVRKAFNALKLQLDPEVFECPLEIPAEFKDYRNPIADRLPVFWDVVAADFHRGNFDGR